MKIDSSDLIRIEKISALMKEAEAPLRILTAVSWPLATREKFFADNCQSIPNPTYNPIDLAPSRSALAAAQTLLTSHPIDQWLGGICEKLRISQDLIDSRGKAEFLENSKKLYGAPETPLLDGNSTPLALAKDLTKTFSKTVHGDFGREADACLLESTAVEMMQNASAKILGNDAPRIEISSEISAKAIAGSNIVKLRSNTCFSEQEIFQLIHHEVGIHVTTFVNGSEQKQFPLLAASHAGTTKTQEGLAVFAELVSGSINISRMQRLADRVLAIKMAIDGADFLEVFKFYMYKSQDNRVDAYELTRRVFRGGLTTGGAPFTKDVVYLDGLLRVHNFLRCAIANGRVDCVQLLFCGKINLDDLPILSQLSANQLIQPPKYLPKWIRDPGFLVAYMAYSNFLNQVHLGRVRQHYTSMLKEMPRCFG